MMIRMPHISQNAYYAFGFYVSGMILAYFLPFTVANFLFLVMLITYATKQYLFPFLQDHIKHQNDALHLLKTLKDQESDRAKQLSQELLDQNKKGQELLVKLQQWKMALDTKAFQEQEGRERNNQLIIDHAQRQADGQLLAYIKKQTSESIYQQVEINTLHHFSDKKQQETFMVMTCNVLGNASHKEAL